MTRRSQARPGFVLALVLGLGAAVVYMLTPVLVDNVAGAMGRRQARSVQLAAARATAAQREDLAHRAGLMERALDEGALFQKGLNVGTMQTAIRTAVQPGGATVRTVTSTVEDIGGKRQRLTSRVVLDGSPEAIQGALTQLEAARPRLLLQDMHVRTAAAGAPDGPVTLTMELEIDAYADLAVP